MADNNNILNEDNMLKMLDTLYDKSLKGISGVSIPVEELAAEYLDRDADLEKAVRIMLNNQIAKCTASGVITGIGGILTLPVSVPANVASIIYMQIRMIACTAFMAGNDLSNDITRALVYACLAGVSTENMTGRVTEEDIRRTRRLAASRMVRRLGEKSALNLVKLIPIIGAGVNGGVDFLQTGKVADRAFRMFLEGEYAYEEGPSLRDRGQEAYETAKEVFRDADLAGLGKKAAGKAVELKDLFMSTVLNKDSETVYVSATGRSYHTDMAHAGKDPVKMTRTEAEKLGYTPCRRCVKE